MRFRMRGSWDRLIANLTSCMTSWLDIMVLTLVVQFSNMKQEIEDNWCLKEYPKLGCYNSSQKKRHDFLSRLGSIEPHASSNGLNWRKRAILCDFLYFMLISCYQINLSKYFHITDAKDLNNTTDIGKQK